MLSRTGLQNCDCFHVHEQRKNLMMPDQGRVILLPHPGKERFPDKEGFCAWPYGSHRRKFLRLKGQWTNLRGHQGKEPLEMWTEYEAPTQANPLNGRQSGKPKYVHEIRWKVGAPILNTDPWIFYPGFVWTTCRHNRACDLHAGDIVLFGSSIKGNWVLDTVFVIDERLPIAKGKFGDTYNALVRSLVPKKACPFIGKTFRNIHIPFSFVPCARANDRHAPFARPCINGLLRDLRKSDGSEPSAANSGSLTVTSFRGMRIAEFWMKLLHLIANQGLVMGTRFEHSGIVINGSANSRKRSCSSSSSRQCR